MGVHDLTWLDVVRRNGRERPGAPALMFGDETLTHGDLLARAERLAAGLAAAGVGHGDRVAILAQNRPDFVDVLAACARLGAICLPVNWRLSPDEIAFVLSDGDPAIVLAEPEYRSAVEGVAGRLAGLRGCYLFDEPASEGAFRAYGDLLSGPDAAPEREVASGDPLVIIHTAAVAGEPRGAVLSHANLVAHNLQLAAAWRLGPEDVALGALPLFHVSGLGLVLALQQAGGASVVMRRFDGAAAAEAIGREGVSVLCEFAPMLGAILDAAREGGRDLASLKAVWGLDSPETIARFEAACPGARFWAGYGQSETSGYVSFAAHRDRPGSAGRPTPMAVLAVVDDEDRPVAAGLVGEIVVRGPLVFSGYWRREADTAFTFRGGWHHTGDMGRLEPEGFLVYAGRSPAKELIKSGGENVYPAEVERVLREHPDVDEAFVFGRPDPRWGEAVVAACVRREGSGLSEAELIDFVGERIARFKRPKAVLFVADLPRAADGRVDRIRARAEHGA